MARKIILHVGVPKTGSTTLQRFLSDNRGLLADRGLAVLQAPGESNHIGLTLYAKERGGKTNSPQRDLFFKKGIKTQADQEHFRAKLRQSLAEEVAGLGPDIGTLILSNEHCATLSRPELEALRALLTPFAAEIEILVYLRRQDRFCVSSYSSDLRNGKSLEIEAHLASASNWRVLRYDELLLDLSQVFGRGAVRPVIFEPSGLREGDLITDLCHRLGLDPLPEAQRPSRQNEALNRQAQVFLRSFNRSFPTQPEGRDRRALRLLMEVINKDFIGQGLLPARDQVSAFLAGFAEGNEAVRREWFPDRPTLFDEDLSDYPEAVDPAEEATLDASLAVLEAVIRHWAEADLAVQREASERRRAARERKEERAAKRAARKD
ncbi:MAG: hypothetical protein AAFY02_17430 [Pseudomonadota bacterium]